MPGFCPPRSMLLMYERSIALRWANSSCEMPCARRHRRIAAPSATSAGSFACRDEMGMYPWSAYDANHTTDDLPHAQRRPTQSEAGLRPTARSCRPRTTTPLPTWPRGPRDRGRHRQTRHGCGLVERIGPFLIAPAFGANQTGDIRPLSRPPTPWRGEFGSTSRVAVVTCPDPRAGNRLHFLPTRGHRPRRARCSPFKSTRRTP